ncbi:MAG: tRNA dihydrouridine(20/20a) synthase DusA, partial [Pseudomonadota bacterium]
PMMDWTDRHCRYFHRLISKHAVLYTEMITAKAIINGDRDHLLQFNPEDHPVNLQIGGSDPEKCAEATNIAIDYGYDEINLNVGCPSDRVQSGRFGACLMREADLVSNIIHKMQNVVNVPVTVKCRLGVDDQDPYATLPNFVEKMAVAGVKHLIIHARKAWLNGLSPKENRTVPPLNYDLVYDIKKSFPDVMITLNGGVKTIQDVQTHLKFVDGVMIGREAYHNPCLMMDVDPVLYGGTKTDYATIINKMSAYIQNEMSKGQKFQNIARHMLGFRHGQRGARKWRRYITEQSHKPNADAEIIQKAFTFFEDTMNVHTP